MGGLPIFLKLKIVSKNYSCWLENQALKRRIKKKDKIRIKKRKEIGAPNTKKQGNEKM